MLHICTYVSVESGATANSGDMAKANKKIKDLEHRLSEKESKIMEITNELMENVKKNRDVSQLILNVCIYALILRTTKPITCHQTLFVRVWG